MTKNCKKCNRKFVSRQWNQNFCGSKSSKIGCSYEEHIKRIQNYNMNEGKNNLNRLVKRWMKKQRIDNTDYAKRQRKGKLKYALIRRKALGKHTKLEWMSLIKSFKNRCAICKITKKELKFKYKGTAFVKLTKDHIIPLRMGGTNYISNIQPLCIGCNVTKRNKIL